ncbi:MAG TPA: hypothetical protein VGM11_05285 [Acidobacteriaceae bacterium]|jgi:hypothetical protein
MDLRKFPAACVALAAVLIAAAAPAAAQVTYKPHETNASREARIERTIAETYSHRWEVFGGGGYMRFRSGQYTEKNNEITWNVQANYFLSPKLSVVGDARGMFGNGKPLRPQTQAINPQINQYTFTGGVGYRFYAKERVAVSGQALGGVGIGNFSGASKGLSYLQTGFWQDAARPAFIVDLAVDLNVYPNLGFRILPTYVGTTFTSPSGGSLQNNLGINFGIIYRFGHQ